MRKGGGGGLVDIFCQTPPLVLHLLILCWDTGQLAAESNHGISTATIIVRRNTSYDIVQYMNGIKH